MSGAVVANFDALQGAAVAPTAYSGIPGSPLRGGLLPARHDGPERRSQGAGP